MFKDNKDGSTHYQNDGCGEPAHNDFVASATHDELCDGALKHYERLSRMSNEWYSLIPKVIEFYRGHGGKNNDAPKEKDWEKRFNEQFGDRLNKVEGNQKIVKTGTKIADITDFIQSEIDCNECTFEKKGGLGNFDSHTCMKGWEKEKAVAEWWLNKLSEALEAQKNEIVDEIRKTYLNTTNESLISATEVISLITKNK